MFKLTTAASLLCSLPMLSSFLSGQQKPKGAVGLFEASNDIGDTLKGSTVYDAVTGEYRVTGGGADMWDAQDDFQFTWVRLSGDVTLTADVRFVDGNVIPFKKAVLMVRQSLDPASPYADVAIHFDGHITLQYRETQGGKTGDILSSEHRAKRLGIERKGNQFTMYAGPSDDRLVASEPVTITMSDLVYVGIGMCSHRADVVETAIFSNVAIDKPAAG